MPPGIIIDTKTDKHIELPNNWVTLDPPGYIPGFGSPALKMPEIRLVPDVTKLTIPPDLLELWAQVAVRGELGEGGQFVPWDEAKWERKRQELTTTPAPLPDFPFPGYLAADKLHWLRQEYENANGAEKPRLAKQLLDRAEAIGDQAEAVRWRAEVDRRAPAAAPPHE